MAMLYCYRVEVQVADGDWVIKTVHSHWGAADRVQKKFTAQGLTARVVSHAIPMYTKTVVQ